MTSKIILLCSLLVIPHVIFGMEEEMEEDNRIIITGYKKSDDIEKLPILKGHINYNICAPTKKAKLTDTRGRIFAERSFTAHYNIKTGITAIHQNSRVAARILLPVDPRHHLTKKRPIIFICAKEGNEVVAYQVNAVTTPAPLADLDEATKLEKQQASHWPTIFASFVGGSMLTAALIIIYQNLYNK